jgi:peptidoglycan/LPS O-acetylase OafA/YrhL
MQFTGQISYSFYLVHALVIVIVRTAVATLNPEITRLPLALLLSVLSLPVAFGVAVLLFRYVELSGAELGKKLMTSGVEKK